MIKGPDDNVDQGETVVAVLKRIDGSVRVIRETKRVRWYSKILRRLKCLR